ncbi:TonB-dependent receptor [Sphingobium lactosutens]|nr:TonB-dependent receptor [Sphingobium lactosutens]
MNEPPARDEAAVIFIVARKTIQFSQQRESGARAAMPLAGHLSRTRVRTIKVEGVLPMDDRTILRLGWSGGKYSNRNANATAAYSNANLRASDWFQPHAALHLAAGRNVLLRASYDENLLAYADIGMSGPLALTREDFRAMQAHLRPERHRRLAFGADWAVAPALRLSFDVYDGRLMDRLTFADGGALPVNRGSADLRGLILAATHRPTPHFNWSLRYGRAIVNRIEGGMVHETQLAAEGQWHAGPWRASLRAARTSTPALLLPTDIHDRSIRVRAAISCQPVATPGLTLGLRIADPDRQASSSFTASDAPLGLRAQDQARSLMLSASLAL